MYIVYRRGTLTPETRYSCCKLSQVQVCDNTVTTYVLCNARNAMCSVDVAKIKNLSQGLR
jgi:hypothetical protein